MEIKDFIQNLVTVFDDVEVEDLTPETNYHDIEEWSSIVALSVIAMIDEEYNVILSGDDIKNASTVQDLFDIVSKKK